MYENCEEVINYNVLFCHACLSSNRTLCSVGEYLDIYRKICDASRIKNLISQVNICGECMAVLKEAHAFKKKVENAQKILDHCIQNQVPLGDNLSEFTLSAETFDSYSISEHENADEYEKYLEKTQMTEDLSEPSDELMFRIEDVRGQCDIMDVRPTLNLSTSSCDVSANNPESPEDDEERRYQQWKKAALLVFKTICSHRYAHHFLKPVSDALAPLYSRIVRRPTDLSTIKRWIKNGVVRTTSELTCALQLMFSNALMYNSTSHKIHQMTLEFREETIHELSLLQEVQLQTGCPPAPQLRRRHSVRECSLSRRPSVRECSISRRPSVRECSISRRSSVRDCSASRRPSVRKSPVPRRRSVRECTTPVWPASSAGVVSLLSPAPVARVSHPLTRRRKSLWDASQEARECPTPVAPAALAGAASPPLALPSRRSAAASVLKPHQPLPRRRKSLWDASQEDEIKTAVALRPRRKSVYQPGPEPPAKRRPKWHWPCLDNEYLVASCFKKYKSTVLL